jgi:hypothetical protein
MGDYLKSVLKTTLLFATVGALVALAAPTVIGFVAPLLSATVPAWATQFSVLGGAVSFGLFGAFSSGLGPVFDGVFGKTETSQPPLERRVHSQTISQQVNMQNARFAEREMARRELPDNLESLGR